MKEQLIYAWSNFSFVLNNIFDFIVISLNYAYYFFLKFSFLSLMFVTASLFTLLALNLLNNLNNIIYHLGRHFSYKRFYTNKEILEDAKEKSFTRLLTEDLIVYTASGYRINDDEEKRFGFKYVKYILDLIGEQILRDYVNIFGSLDNFITYLIYDFQQRVHDMENTILENEKEEGLNSEDIYQDEEEDSKTLNYEIYRKNKYKYDKYLNTGKDFTELIYSEEEPEEETEEEPEISDEPEEYNDDL